eukprot:Skav202012  [mRNA]  locus=scaffold1829:171393:183950:- [translate_table: standard]
MIVTTRFRVPDRRSTSGGSCNLGPGTVVMADPHSLNKVSAESSWHNGAGRQARRELFHQTRSRHKHAHADAATYADAESLPCPEPMPNVSSSSTATGSASRLHSPGQQATMFGLRAQDLASSLTELVRAMPEQSMTSEQQLLVCMAAVRCAFAASRDCDLQRKTAIFAFEKNHIE